MSFGENCLLEKESYPLYSPFILTGRAKRQKRAINLHLYHYAGNNPVRYSDPDGRKIQVTQTTDRGAVLNMINSISKYKYKIDENGYLVKDGNKLNGFFGL